jgi:cell wall-associated NlpC family hydrolase
MSIFLVLIVPLSIIDNIKSKKLTENAEENNIIDNIDNENNDQEENTYTEEEKETDTFIEKEEDTLNLTSVMVQALVTLNVREEPTTNSSVIGTLTQFESVNYLESYNDSWYEVYYDNNIAYVSSYFEYSRIYDNTSNDYIDKVIEEGIYVLGTPYEYGSARLLNYDGNFNSNYTGNTFDCSAFVQYIFFMGASIKLYGDSRSMSVQGTTVEFKNLKRGDVIFMTSTSRMYNVGIERIGHVGIYLGNNQIMHTFGTGGVRIQIYSDFWKGRFITAKRMI